MSGSPANRSPPLIQKRGYDSSGRTHPVVIAGSGADSESGLSFNVLLKTLSSISSVYLSVYIAIYPSACLSVCVLIFLFNLICKQYAHLFAPPFSDRVGVSVRVRGDKRTKRTIVLPLGPRWRLAGAAEVKGCVGAAS